MFLVCIKKPHMAIAISSHALRAVQTDSNGAILKSAEVALEPNTLEGNQINIELLSKAFIQLKEAGGFETNYTVLALPEKFAFTREHEIPSTQLSEVGEAIFWAIEEIFPFSKEEIFTDWRIIEQDKYHTKVMVVAMLKDVLQDIKNSLEIAKLTPLRFEPVSSVLTTEIKDISVHPIIIIEADASNAAATLVINEVPKATSTVLQSSDPNAQYENIKDTIINATNNKKLQRI